MQDSVCFQKAHATDKTRTLAVSLEILVLVFPQCFGATPIRLILDYIWS